MKYKTIDVAVPGGELRVGVWEPADDPQRELLLIHGVTASHRAFDWLVKFLPNTRIIAPDLRGRGRSSQVQGPSSMARHAADMIAVLDAVGAVKPSLVGHSMGAFIGLVLANKYPERVKGLLLVDGVCHWKYLRA